MEKRKRLTYDLSWLKQREVLQTYKERKREKGNYNPALMRDDLFSGRDRNPLKSNL